MNTQYGVVSRPFCGAVTYPLGRSTEGEALKARLVPPPLVAHAAVLGLLGSGNQVLP
jgi:hypothetical protein